MEPVARRLRHCSVILLLVQVGGVALVGRVSSPVGGVPTESLRWGTAVLLLLVVTLVLLAPVAPPTGYERAWAAVPMRHRLLVASIHVDRDSGGQARRRDMSIHLTPYRSDGQLHHEVGHLVLYADPALERDWQAAFWPGGRLRGIPPSRYARTNDREDAAESYEEMLQHGCLEDPARTRFMLERVFRPGETPTCREPK
jgi:hypothetical protein